MKSQIKILVAIITSGITVAAFQNCSKVQFQTNPGFEKLNSASVAMYVTDEDTPIAADLNKDHATLASVMNLTSVFSITRQPAHGHLDFNLADAQFTYTPDANFFGEDSFDLSELPDGRTQAIGRTVSILVRSINDLPAIKTDFLSFDLNSSKNPVILEMTDIDNVNIIASFSSDDRLPSLKTPNGLLEKKDGKVLYTPDTAFRGVEQVDFWAIDSEKGASKKRISISVGNPFRDMQPALAIRGMGCVACHANVRSQVITDFGFGSAWFAATNAPVSHLNANRVLTFNSGNMFGDHADNWKTASIVGPVLVPRTNAVTMGGVTQTLASYLTGLEGKKTAPAPVIEKESVYIGAPSVSQLEARFQINVSVSQKFVPNEVSSPALSGLKMASGYYINDGPLVCDGDLFVRGTVYLNQPTVHTKNGCRIHATGPIFLQGAPTYVNLGDAMAANNTNLQLVSARAIVAGVGLTHCETGTQWYATNKIANPLKERLLDIWTAKSHVSRQSQDNVAEGNFILAEAAKLQGYQDASCYVGGRSVHIERILFNAPMVQSRLTGNVSGVVITEVALFSLNAFSYEFDQVFKRVPVLPLLKPTDFLAVQNSAVAVP